MTKTSLEELVKFLNSYPIAVGRTADFGGTNKVGGGIVKKTLATGGITDYHMLDLDNGVDLSKPIPGEKFALGLCMDLLEHTINPFVVAHNIQAALKKGAFLFVTAPFIWEIHLYPGDFWRFTQQGLQQLFLDMQMYHIYIVADDAPGGSVPRHRVVGIFRKTK